MIEVTYHRKHNGFTAVGHANTAPKGEDLVCAAVTSLVLTLSANVEQLAAAGALLDHSIRVESGAAEISCTPVRRMGSVVTLTFDAICTGFAVLQSMYPDSISYREA